VNLHFKPLQPGQQDLIRYYSTTYGFNSEADETGSHVATLMVELLSADERDARCDDVLRLWQEHVGEIPDAVSILFDQMEIGPGGKPIDIQLVGDDLEALKQASLDLQKRIRTYPGVENLMDDLRPGKNEIHVRLEPTGRSLGVTSQELSRQVRGAFWHEKAEEFQRGENTFDVDVRLAPVDRKSLSDLEDFRIVLPNGAQIPFEEVARAEEARGFSKIVRVDGRRTASIAGDVDSRKGNAAKIMEDLKEHFFPAFLAEHDGVFINLEGEQKETATTMKSVIQGLIIGLVIIFILLSFVFESYVDPFIVMTTIPLGLVGAVFGHVVMGKDWTMPSIVGFVSLSGIVVNDAIVLVTFIKDRIRAGIDPYEAILRAGKRRFLPIFLTTATTVAGLLPLLLEKSLQAQILIPLTVSIAFGLTFASLLTLVLIPCLYSLLTDLKRLWKGSTCS
jgi:multidrug efflux pump subunit AcrB